MKKVLVKIALTLIVLFMWVLKALWDFGTLIVLWIYGTSRALFVQVDSVWKEETTTDTIEEVMSLTVENLY